MPFATMNSGSWEFLREFHFQSATNSIISKLLGDVPQPTSWEVRVDTVAAPVRHAIDLGVTITIKPHFVLIAGEREDRPGWYTTTEKSIPNIDLHGFSHQERITYFVTFIEALLTSLGPNLYEHDPRIGHLAWKAKLPESPLLDPPGRWARQPSQFGSPETCPLCGEEITSNREFMWGGGNLMWVHPACWRDA